MRTLEIDFVIETSLVALFSRDLFAEHIYLKGGQALRMKENLRSRFSADIDFSTAGAIDDDHAFFELMEAALTQEFFQNGYCLFDFRQMRRPSRRIASMPDFWSGWAVEFKLTEESKRNLPSAERQRSALTPRGASSPKISFDISEHEYCGSVEKLKVRSVEVNVYSRTLLVLEKLRAICQQHPDYRYKSINQRARDYYDVERLWGIVLKADQADSFLAECALHLEKVFAAKDVSLDFLQKIGEQSFQDLQKSGWPAVVATVSGKLQPFEYYAETCAFLISEIRTRLSKSL